MNAAVAPLWSVVVPTCNRPDLLEQCLSHLRPEFQTAAESLYEVIVTDDSVDGQSRDMVRDRFPWIRWVQGPRRGPAANRNNGMKLARGVWLAFCDDDCLAEAGWLAAFDSARSGSCLVYEGKTVCRRAPLTAMEHAPINLSGGHLLSCNFAIQSGLLRELGGFDEGFPFPHLEDIDLKVRILDRGCEIRFVSSAIVDHPPRAQTGPKRSTQYLESELYYHHVKRRIRLPPQTLFSRVVWSRVRSILVHQFSQDTLRATAALCQEVCYMVAQLPALYRKYPPPPQNPP